MGEERAIDEMGRISAPIDDSVDALYLDSVKREII